MLNGNGRNLKKVLLIENDEFNICVTSSFLYACGDPHVIVARNAKEALEQFVRGVDLILLNVGLPDMPGLELCKKLREMNQGKSIPILALAPKGKGIRTKCFKVGASNVMSGPTSFQGFKNAIHSVLG